MKASIHYLQEMLETLETNEVDYRNDCNTPQADICAMEAAELRGTIAVLKAIVNGPIWPAPQESDKDAPRPGIIRNE